MLWRTLWVGCSPNAQARLLTARQGRAFAAAPGLPSHVLQELLVHGGMRHGGGAPLTSSLANRSDALSRLGSPWTRPSLQRGARAARRAALRLVAAAQHTSQWAIVISESSRLFVQKKKKPDPILDWASSGMMSISIAIFR